MVDRQVLGPKSPENRLPTVGEVIDYLKQFRPSTPVALDDEGAGDFDDVAVLGDFFDAYTDHS